MKAYRMLISAQENYYIYCIAFLKTAIGKQQRRD